ncbi:transporter substrate-binding domain-containing protein [Thalassomonas haliotis]|uniref:Transporter substrate-binding domain-containing protein n=1 Tax=Thalassomonas haliotis TaxID=485448 RepID=A0ABY7VA23_9GAMM|nr:transporter substrate-binding domain-containing protein [Thalassomonas haliotis]WDE10140.1 transporter substrate-binding domain-containing protein [Thalassomonas haliotis]
MLSIILLVLTVLSGIGPGIVSAKVPVVTQESLSESRALSALNPSSLATQPLTPDNLGPVTVAINKTSYPYHFINEQGRPDGLAVDLWRLWGDKQGIDVEFLAFGWQETLSKVSSGEVTLHAGMAQLSDREKAFAYFSPNYLIANHLYLHRDLSNITSIGQVTPFAIGVVKGSLHVDSLQNKYPALVLKLYDSRHQLYDAALKGEVRIFAGIENLSKNYVGHDKLAALFPPYRRLSYDHKRYGSVMSKNNPVLFSFIQQGLSQITPQELMKIERKWLGMNKQKGVLSLAFSALLPPYMAVSPSGKPQGLFIDIWRLWSQYSGHKVEFIADEMQGAIDKVKQHQADVHIAYPINDRPLDGLLSAWPLYKVQSRVYVSNRLPGLKKLRDLAGKRVGIFKTAPYHQEVAQQYPGLKLVYYTNHSEMINDGEAGLLDAMVSEVENMRVKLVKANLQSSFYLLDQPVFQSKISSMVSNDNEKLVEIIRDGFAHIPLTELIALEKKWLSQQRYPYFEQLKYQVKLNNTEQQWLSQNPVVKVGMVKKWPPMEFVDKQGEFSGINRDVLNLIGERAGIQFDYVAFDNWQLLYQALLDKKVDMVASAKSSEQRKAQLLFSQSYWQMPWVILHPRHIGKQSSIRYFIGKELAIVKGYQLIGRLKKDYPHITLRLVDTVEEGLMAVQQGLADGFIETIAATSELLKRESMVTLMISVVEEHDLEHSHLAIRKDWPELESIVNKGIASISEDKTQDIYERWFGIEIDTGFDKNVVMRVAAQAGFIIFIIILVIMLWNRRLQVEISRSKALKVQMNHMATHDELTGLANRVLLKEQINSSIAFHQRQQLEMAVLFIDLDGFKSVNDNYGHDVGDELLVQLAQRLLLCVRKSDTVARFGGDEFVLVLTGLHHKSEAAFIADKVIHQAQMPFTLSAATVNIGCSIGIAVYPDDGVSEPELIKIADTLMYKVKGKGKNHYSFA